MSWIYKEKAAYEICSSGWRSDVCSSDLRTGLRRGKEQVNRGTEERGHGRRRRETNGDKNRVEVWKGEGWNGNGMVEEKERKRGKIRGDFRKGLR